VRIEGRIMIDRPAEDVWKFLSEPSNWTKKDPDALEAKLTSEGPVAVGSTGLIRYPKQTLSIRFIEYDPNTKIITVEFTSGHIKGTKTTYRMQSIDKKTKLTRTDELNFSGIHKLQGQFIARRMMKTVENELNNTQRIMESQS